MGYPITDTTVSVCDMTAAIGAHEYRKFSHLARTFTVGTGARIIGVMGWHGVVPISYRD
jgi:hypothetical protein